MARRRHLSPEEADLWRSVAQTARPMHAAPLRLPEAPGIAVVFEEAEGEKCERCWKILPDVGSHAHPATCDRCDAVLDAAGV